MLGFLFFVTYLCYVVTGFQLQSASAIKKKTSATALYGRKALGRASKLSKDDREPGNALEFCLDTSLAERNVILMVDSNNVRGKEDFKLTNSELFSKLKAWRRQLYPTLNIVCHVDHGSLPDIFEYDGLGLVQFAGPNRTADDAIAQSAYWFSNVTIHDEHVEENTDLDVFVITSDNGLKLRCLQSNGNFKRKRKVKENVKVFASQQLLQSFERIQNDDSTETEDGKTNPLHQTLEEQVLQVEMDLRSYEQLRPPWPNQAAKAEAMAAGPWVSSLLGASKKPEYPTYSFNEKTWHRIVVAENMRRRMQTLSQSEAWSTMVASDLLRRYQSTYKDFLSSIDTSPVNMVLDNRIRLEQTIQIELVEYLEASIDSISDNPSPKASPKKTPVEMAAELLEKIVLEAPDKTQDQILLRYLNEAPDQLQFPAKDNLKGLLTAIAVRQKPDGSTRKQWCLRSDPPRLDCWPIQPGMTSPKQRKRNARLSLKSGPVDEALAARGIEAEEKWFELVQLPSNQ